MIEKNELEVLGQMDSVLVIELVAKDTLGEVVEHELNNQQIIISKQNGFVETFNFYDFPEDVGMKSIVGYQGSENVGIVPPTFDEVFNFEIGSEYHYHQLIESAFSFDFSEYHTKKNILDKTVSANLDTIIYLIEKIQFSRWSNWPNPIETSLDTTIINDVYIRSDYGRFEKMPYQFAFEDDYGGFLSMYLDGENIILKESYSYSSLEEGCIEEMVGSGIFYDQHYDKCRGMFARLNGSGNFAKLIYYQKGGEEWGTPIDFITLDVDEVLLSGNSFKVSPNPANHFFNIESEDFQNENIVIEIFNLNGQNILSRTEWFNEKTDIDISSLSTGMVILKISTTQGVYLEKLMIGHD